MGRNGGGGDGAISRGRRGGRREERRVQDALAHAQAQLANDKELKPNPEFVKAFQK